MKPFWNERRCRYYTFSAVVGWLVAYAIVLLTPAALPESALGSGDLPGFLTPAAILAMGEGGQVYDPALQYEIQRSLWPDRPAGFLMSVYPAPVFVLLLPLMLFGVVIAKGIFAATMAIAAGVTARMLGGLSRSIGLDDGYPLAWMLLYPPFMVSIIGAQNTALTCLLMVAVIAALSAPQSVLPGILCGVACYKPQFGALLLFWTLCARPRAGVGVGAIAVVGAGYVAGAIWCGWSWPAEWLEALAKFAPQNFVVNGHQMTSFQSLASQSDSVVLTALSWMIGGAIAIYVALRAARVRNGERPAQLAAHALWGPAAVIISPQALFYDSALAVVGILIGFDRRRRGDPWMLACVLVAGGALIFARETLPINLFPALGLAIFGYVAVRERAINVR